MYLYFWKKWNETFYDWWYMYIKRKFFKTYLVLDGIDIFFFLMKFVAMDTTFFWLIKPK